jgi:hypothetical protein
MKRLLIVVVLLWAAYSVEAETSPSDPSQEQLAALVMQVREQQVQLAANQAKIDEKLANLAEALRLARIYASRGGH